MKKVHALLSALLFVPYGSIGASEIRCDESRLSRLRSNRRMTDTTVSMSLQHRLDDVRSVSVDKESNRPPKLPMRLTERTLLSPWRGEANATTSGKIHRFNGRPDPSLDVVQIRRLQLAKFIAPTRIQRTPGGRIEIVT
jgi:hypothetical protein